MRSEELELWDLPASPPIWWTPLLRTSKNAWMLSTYLAAKTFSSGEGMSSWSASKRATGVHPTEPKTMFLRCKPQNHQFSISHSNVCFGSFFLAHLLCFPPEIWTCSGYVPLALFNFEASLKPTEAMFIPLISMSHSPSYLQSVFLLQGFHVALLWPQSSQKLHQSCHLCFLSKCASSSLDFC